MPAPINQKGIGLVEGVIYIAILAVILVLVINTVLAMFSAYSQARVLRRVSLDAESGLERMVREIRLSQRIDASSQLGSDSSRLVLNTIRSADDPVGAVKEFYLSGNRLAMKTDGGPEEFLTSNNTDIDVFKLEQIITGRSEAVKITFSLTGLLGRDLASRTFYASAVLRGSY